MSATDFAPYRTTPRTLVRPPQTAFQPRYTVAQTVHEDLRRIERADHDLARSDADSATSHRLLREALTRNAYGTASIEGNPLSLAEVESLLTHQATPDNAIVPDEREILNYATFTGALATTPVPRTPRDVCALHASLFEGVLPRPGRLKTKANFIGRRETREVVYVPTSPGDTAKELASALDWLNDAAEHPIVRASVFFHEFQSIHPFLDGNGRLGRALTTLMLWHSGYRGVRYALVDYAFNEDRDVYYATLDAARHGDAWGLTPWIAYMTGILRVGFEDAVRRFLFRDGLPRALNERQVKVAEWFARLDGANRGRRVKLNDVHAAFPHVPTRTLQADLARLAETGVIERKGERKGATYARAEARNPSKPPSAFGADGDALYWEDESRKGLR